MARSIKDIQAEMLAAIAADSRLSTLVSTSATAIYRLFTYAVAASIWGLEVLFDSHKTEVAALMATKPHQLRWYVEKTLAFQYGSSLPSDSDTYNNALLTESEIAAQKIVAAAAAIEVNGRVLIKAAKLDGQSLIKLTTPQYNSLKSYLNEVKDAGVKIDLISQEGDRFKLTIDIFYDSQILASDGTLLDGTSNTPIKDAILAFLQNCPFDGLFVKSKLTDALQLVDGVIVPEIRSAQAARYDVVVWQPIDVFYQPYAGWLKFYNETTDLVINYIAT